MRRIVVKVGSAVLTQNEDLANTRIINLIKLLVDLKQKYEVIFVSSGAVMAGYTQLKLDTDIIENKQALAAIGQPLLMKKYRREFLKYNIQPAQILLTANNLQSPNQKQRIKNTIDVLLKNNVIPIINENDATAIDELVVGDNDQLSAYVACDTDADLLVILSDIEGYYDDDPHKNSNAKLKKIVTSIDENELNKSTSAHHKFATGGIVTKLKAASYMLTCKKDMFLASGFDLDCVREFLLNKNDIGGTLFTCHESGIKRYI